MTDRTQPDSGSIITSSDILLHDAETALLYEELRAAIDDGHESMTHADALAEVAAMRAENIKLRAQLEAVGAGGVQALSAAPGVTSEQRRLIGVIADKIEDGTLFQSGIYPKKDLARFVRNMLDTTPTAPAATPTPPAEQQAQPDECFPGEPKVAVPQGLISAACFAIRNKRDGGKVLEQLRRYSVGDRSQPLAPQQAAPKAAPGEPPGIQALMCVISSLHSLRDTAHFSDEEGELTNALCTLRDWAYAQTASQPEHDLKDVPCECCGYMTYHREHMGCIRAAAPKAEPEVGNSGFDHKTAADFLNGKTVSDEAVLKFVQASRWAHDERAALSATLLAMHGVLTSREAEIALLKKALLEAEAAPQQEAQEPCPTCVALARTVMLDQVSFDRKPDCYGIRQITNDEGIEEWEDIRTSPDVAREEANDMMATGRGELYEVVPLWTTPQPAPAPLSESEYKRGYRDGYERRDAEVRGALV